MDIEALLHGGVLLPEGVRQVPQALQGVAFGVGLDFHGGEAQLPPGLDKQHKEHPVHIPHALDGQRLRVHRVPLQVPAQAAGHVVEHLAAQQLDALPQGKFQVLGYPRSAALGRAAGLVDPMGAVLHIPFQRVGADCKLALPEKTGILRGHRDDLLQIL